MPSNLYILHAAGLYIPPNLRQQMNCSRADNNKVVRLVRPLRHKHTGTEQNTFYLF